MKKFYAIAGLALAAMSCATAPQTTVSLHVEGKGIAGKAHLVTLDSTYTIALDSTHAGTVTLAEGVQPCYATLHLGRAQAPVYIEPGKSFDMTLKIEGYRSTTTFTGEGAAKNTYLHGDAFRQFRPDFKADEATFIKAVQDAEADLVANLEAQEFDAAFVAKEKERIHYSIYGALSMYPSYHSYYAQDAEYKPTEAYYAALKAAVQENAELLAIPGYKDMLEAYVGTFAGKDKGRQMPVDYVKAQLEVIQQDFKNPAIVEYLVDKTVTAHVGRYGVDDLAQFGAIYDSKVTDAEKKAAFKALCDKWAKIAKGQPSIKFNYKDINGKEVSLDDLKGKYVYIDCWATWCGPCRGELPHLKKLEHKYKNKNIHFVSISCDQDKAAWEKMVKEDKLGGIQLHNGGDNAFMDFFMIRGIPRFILLDREGNILQSNATRPSNPETAKTFDALPGI